MNLKVIILLVFVNILFLPVAYSEMFTCQAADGSKSFSDKPCQGNGSTLIKKGPVPVNENIQESNEIRRFMAVSERKAAERKMEITEQRNRRQAAEREAEREAAKQQTAEQEVTKSDVEPTSSRPKVLVKLHGGPGYVDTDGTYYPEVPGGAVDTETGKFIPAN